MSRQDFITKLANLAELIPNLVLSEQILLLYDQFLAPLGYDKLCIALDTILVNRSSRDPFPSIREIRNQIFPEDDPEHLAEECANRLFEAVCKKSSYLPDEAKKCLNSVEWTIVERNGGWQNLCLLSGESDHTTLRAQWRRHALAIITREKKKIPSIQNRRLRISHGHATNGGKLVNLGEMITIAKPNDQEPM